MTQPSTPHLSETPSTASTNASPATQDRLNTGDGQITVAESLATFAVLGSSPIHGTSGGTGGAGVPA